MKQLADALKITAELTVQSGTTLVSQSRAWSTSMSTGKRGREDEKETEKEKEEGIILTINRRERV